MRRDRRLPRNWAILIMVLFLASMDLKTAISHPYANWYDIKWKASHDHTGQNITWRFSPGFPDGEKKERVSAGFNQWNNLGEQMRFEHLFPAATNSYTAICDGDPQDYNGVFFNNVDGPGGLKAITYVCYHPNSPYHTGHHFTIKFDEDDSWHAGISNGPDYENDIGGAATHEAGHATGGWITNLGSTGHWPDDYAACSDNPTHTMCSRQITPYSFRSLEEHDRHTFTDFYP